MLILENSLPNETKKTAAETIIELAQSAPEIEFFHSEKGEAFASFEAAQARQTERIRGSKFKTYLIEWYFEMTGKPAATDSINQAISVLEMLALRKGDQRKLDLRVSKYEGSFYYDLAEPQGRAVQISPSEVLLIDKPPSLFYRTAGMSAQVKPDFDGKLSLFLNHIRLAFKSDYLLFLVYIVSCFIPGIPHPILVLSGEKGAAKSTTARMIRSIVDPSAVSAMTMPSGIRDLALNLSNNYMPCYDNIDFISAEKSDMLCTASTGGGSVPGSYSPTLRKPLFLLSDALPSMALILLRDGQI